MRLLLLGVLLLPVSGCLRHTGLPEGSFPEAGFKAKFPGQPKKEVQDGGPLVTVARYEVEDKKSGSFFTVQVFNFSREVEILLKEKGEKAFLNNVIDSARKEYLNGKYTLGAENARMLANVYPGWELQGKLPNSVGLFRSRFYLVRKRVYQITVLGIPSLVNSPDASAFLDSFALIQ
jgi:hypothetical protein